MMAILLDHTEIYCTGGNIIGYHLYVADVLIVFFFLSGYLFRYSEREKGCSPRHKLFSILRSLLVPYLIFTTAIAFPKALAHGLPISHTLLSVVTGQASWFIAALIVAETVFALLLWISRGREWMLSVAALFSLLLCGWLSHMQCALYWQLDNACMAFPVLYLGFLYQKREAFFARFDTLRCTCLLFVLWMAIKVYVSYAGVSLLVEPVCVSNWIVFVVNMLISVLFLVSLFRQFPRFRFLRPVEWTGSHSLVYYFLCGGVPLTVSALMHRMGFVYTGNYLYVLVAYVLVWVSTTFLVWLIYRYLPFTVGRWKTAV